MFVFGAVNFSVSSPSFIKKLKFFKATHNALKLLQSSYILAQNCKLELEINMLLVIAKWL